MASAVTFFAVLLPFQGAAQNALPGSSVPDDRITKLLPEHAIITARVSVTFENGIKGSTEAVAFTLPPVYAESYNAGLRILRQTETAEWKLLYEEERTLDPRGDELSLQKVRADGGAEALVVVDYHSGAGTTTDWKVVVAQKGKLHAIESKPIRDRVLAQRNSTFGGYNGIRVEGDAVIETIPLYSKHAARCCSDRPPVAMRVRFTGAGLKLDSVTSLQTGK